MNDGTNRDMLVDGVHTDVRFRKLPHKGKLFINMGLAQMSQIKSGMKTLRKDGARKVVEGSSTVEEVLRVTQLDS